MSSAGEGIEFWYKNLDCDTLELLLVVIVVLWTRSHILYGLPLYQKGNISKATY